MKATWCMWVLRSLQGQLTSFHFLIASLKPFRETTSLISVGISSQILGPKNETYWCLKFMEFLGSQKSSFSIFFGTERVNNYLSNVIIT